MERLICTEAPGDHRSPLTEQEWSRKLDELFRTGLQDAEAESLHERVADRSTPVGVVRRAIAEVQLPDPEKA
ncbi:MAG: hypothetical protein QM733_15085 [Ilumatobacteraceae bacterium]